MFQRSLLLFVCTTLFCLKIVGSGDFAVAESVAVANKELTVGDRAPELDIEHWLQDGNGYFKPVKKFATGKIYVIEFWETTCTACRAGMPMLAELQNKYRKQDVQVIGISPEQPAVIKSMLKMPSGEPGKTFGEVTSAYSLVSDPDASTFNDYMAAAGIQFIPTAFVVGRKGEIEWIGSPFDIDEPLEKIIDGSWDLAAYKKEVAKEKAAEKQLSKNVETIARLQETGKYEEAVKFAAQRVKDAPNQQLSGYWESVKHMLKLVSGKVDTETKGYFGAQFKMMREEKNLDGILQLSNELCGVSEMGGKLGPLGNQAIAVIQAIGNDNVTKEAMPYYHNTLANLFDVTGDFKKAAAQQQEAIRLSNPRQQKRMQPYLKELRKKAGLDSAK
jgi:thiol-disulfide isomerase/thioredoxin